MKKNEYQDLQDLKDELEKEAEFFFNRMQKVTDDFLKARHKTAAAVTKRAVEALEGLLDRFSVEDDDEPKDGS